jgi:hypothetical protein
MRRSYTQLKLQRRTKGKVTRIIFRQSQGLWALEHSRKIPAVAMATDNTKPHLPLWIVRTKRLVRSPFLSGEFGLKDCTFRIGWPFFPARTERYVRAGVTFFGHPKKVTNGKDTVKGKFRSIEMFLIL